MRKEEMKIGLALSGGGMRAAIYHLGILKALAEEGLLSNIKHISTVSGASICMGLIYGCNGNTWPSNHLFLNKVLPEITRYITTKDIQWTSLARLLISPYYWDKKVNLVAKVMEQKWSVYGCLQDISCNPIWTINTTSYETGKDFRFSSKRMGEMNSSFVMKPKFKLSHAMAASAGFPVLIGPYKLKTEKYTWTDATGSITVRPKDKVLHLWDGGVYDNMGLDPLFTMANGGSLTTGINYIIVSNASGNIEHKSRKYSFSIENLKRLLDINMDQVESLKSNGVIDYFRKEHNGLYFKIGTEVKDIVKDCSLSYEQKESMIKSSMKSQDVSFVKDYKTTLEKVNIENFHKILQHGYETSKYTIASYGRIS